MIESARALPVTWRETPFCGAPRLIAIEEGPTIAEIVALVPDLPTWFHAHGLVCVNGEPVPREMWARVRPRTSRGREVQVTLHAELQGGGDALKAVAAIAIAVIAITVSGGALAPLLGASFAAGTIGASLAGAAVGLGGALALGALAPPPSLDRKFGGFGGGGFDRASSNSASLRGNSLAAGAPLPRVIGTHRVFPPFISPPLTEIVGDDEYVEAIMGLAGPHSLTDIRVGTTPVDSIDEIEYEVKAPGSGAITLVTRQAYTHNIQLDLSAFEVKKDAPTNLVDQTTPANSLPQWHQMTSRAGADEVWVTLNWRQGLFDASGGATLIMQMPVRARIRPRGTLTWTNLPEIHFESNLTAPFSKMFKLMWVSGDVAAAAGPTKRGPTIAYGETRPQSTFTPVTGEWLAADRFFSGGSGGLTGLARYVADTGSSGSMQNVALFEDRVEFYLDVATKGLPFEIEVKIGCPIPATAWSVANYTVGSGPAIIYDLFGYRLSGSIALAPQDIGDRYYSIDVPRIASVWNEHPIKTPGDFTAIAIRVHNRQVDTLSALASGLVRDWTGSEWGNTIATSNPAPHFRDVLAGALNVDRLPPDLLDNAELVAWRTHCASESLTVNAVVEGRSAGDVLAMIAAAGNARPRQSEVWGVIVDKDRSAESPVQTFSPRNMRSFRWTKAFAERPDGLRVRFSDSATDYEETEFIVLDPQSSGNGAKIEEIRYDGIVTEERATERALFDLKQGRSRMTFYSGEADYEAIVCRRGDLVGVQHDTLDRTAGFARIREVVKSGTSVTGLILDGSVINDEAGFYTEGTAGDGEFYVDAGGAFYAGGTLGISIRRTDGTITTHAVTASGAEATLVTLSTPFTDASGLVAPGCHVTAGRLGSEYRRLIVTDVRPGSGGTAQLSFVDEAPEIFA